MCACLLRAHMLADRLAMPRPETLSHSPVSKPTVNVSTVSRGVGRSRGRKHEQRQEKGALLSLLQGWAQAHQLGAASRSNHSRSNYFVGGRQNERAARGNASARCVLSYAVY